MLEALERFAPLPLQESWDNAGLQIGLTEAEVSGALLCLDVTPEIIDEALSLGCTLIVSHHPLNPLVAIGPLAKEMMLHNLDGEKPSPHGPNSCWKYCYDHDAFVIGLGVDLDHYNTISHINEEAFGNWKWTDEQWYRDRRFCIIDEAGNKELVTVHERKPEWGMLRFAEINANRDRNKSGLIHRTTVDGIALCVEKARDYVDYLQSNNKNGIFYYR